MNIDELQAGQELDALIAEVVMEWTGESVARGGCVAWMEWRDGFDGLEWTGYLSAAVPGLTGEIRARSDEGGLVSLVTGGREWKPSTNIAAAWQVVKKVKKLHNVCLSLEEYQFDGKHWQASFKGKFDKDEGKWDRLDYAFADTPELAICRAALKVVAIES